MPGLGPLAELDLGHHDRIMAGALAKMLGVEMALGVAAPEIARTDFPHDVATMLEMVGRQAAFTGVMIEAADLCAQIERFDRIGAERAETHGRNVEPRRLVGLAALVRADRDTGIAFGIAGRSHGVGQPLVFLGIDVELGAEGMGRYVALGSGIDQGALVMAERPPIQIAFDDVGAQERAEPFEEPAQPRRARIVAAQRMVGLRQVDHRDQQQGHEQRQQPPRAGMVQACHDSPDGPGQRHEQQHVARQRMIAPQRLGEGRAPTHAIRFRMIPTTSRPRPPSTALAE